MRTLALAFAASLLVAGCSGTTSDAGGTTSVVSCDWGTGLCDQYGGTIDPTFAANLQTTCGQHGVAFANAPCPTVNQVAGHCALASSGGMTSSVYYYSPTYDSATAQVECESPVVGVTWVP